MIFVLNLYYKNRPKAINDLGGLRWYLFTKYQYLKLPPTKKAFEQMVLRAQYTCLQWKSSHIPSPQLPNPNDCGWNWNQDDKIYEPLMTTNALPLIPSSNLVYIVARLVVKVEDVTKTICYVLKCIYVKIVRIVRMSSTVNLTMKMKDTWIKYFKIRTSSLLNVLCTIF